MILEDLPDDAPESPARLQSNLRVLKNEIERLRRELDSKQQPTECDQCRTRLKSINDLKLQIKQLKYVAEKTTSTEALTVRIQNLEAENRRLCARLQEAEKEAKAHTSLGSFEVEEKQGKKKKKKKARSGSFSPKAAVRSGSVSLKAVEPMSAERAESLIGDFYVKKVIADKDKGPAQSFQHFCEHEFLDNNSVESLSLGKVFLNAVQQHRHKGKRLQTFAILYGMDRDEWFAEHNQHFFVEYLARCFPEDKTMYTAFESSSCSLASAVQGLLGPRAQPMSSSALEDTIDIGSLTTISTHAEVLFLVKIIEELPTVEVGGQPFIDLDELLLHVVHFYLDRVREKVLDLKGAFLHHGYVESKPEETKTKLVVIVVKSFVCTCHYFTCTLFWVRDEFCIHL